MRNALLGLLVLGLSVATLATSAATVLGTFYFYRVPDSTVITTTVRQDPLHSLSIAHRSDRDEPSRAERQQPGFRIADRFGHDRLHPIDHDNGPPMGKVVASAGKKDGQRGGLPFFVSRRIPPGVLWCPGARRSSR